MEFLLTSTSGGDENRIPNAVIKKYTKREVRSELIITSAIDNESIPAIEIYNGYRE